jgi:hypothetical protein
MLHFAQETRRRLVAALAAAAMVGATVVATTAPAKASPDADDIARALAAIAALAIIANAANGDDRPTYRPPYYAPPVYRPPYQPPYQPPYHPPYHPQPKPPAHGAKVLPDSCRVAVVDRENRRNVYYTASCLRRAGVERLPQGCQTEVRLNGGKTRVYRDNCLFNNGFRTEYR